MHPWCSCNTTTYTPRAAAPAAAPAPRRVCSKEITALRFLQACIICFTSWWELPAASPGTHARLCQSGDTAEARQLWQPWANCRPPPHCGPRKSPCEMCHHGLQLCQRGVTLFAQTARPATAKRCVLLGGTDCTATSTLCNPAVCVHSTLQLRLQLVGIIREALHFREEQTAALARNPVHDSTMSRSLKTSGK